MKCRMIPNNGALEIVTPYMASFVSELKQLVPASDRAYDGNSKRWTVSAQYGQTVGALIAKCFGQWIDVPAVQTAQKLGILELLYLGRTKPRDNGERTAFGWTKIPGQLIGSWGLIFPEAVLRSYFDPAYTEQVPGKPKMTTFYETLGIKQAATIEEVKAGYRRMVKQWHPDVCRDPDAHNVFISIQKAYETLSDPRLKARYDVGLKMSVGMDLPKAQKADDPLDSYRAPLKCGNILCQYTELGSRKTVQKILQWEDIYNAAGQILVSSWVMGDSEPTLDWR